MRICRGAAFDGSPDFQGRYGSEQDRQRRVATDENNYAYRVDSVGATRGIEPAGTSSITHKPWSNSESTR